VGNLPTPARDGYTFDGWYTSANGGGTKYTAATTYGATAAISLHAKWTPNGYTLTFNAQGGTVSPASKPATFGAMVGELPDPARGGYTFSGWYTSASGGAKYTESTVYGIAADTVLHARWTANSYTLSFDAQGGTVSPTMHSVTYGAAVGNLPTPVRSGYIFGGWYTQPEGGGTQYAVSTVHSSAAMFTTLYAKWIDESQAIFHVTFDVNGGSSVIIAQEVKYNGLVARPADPTQSGYTFAGWWKDAGFTTRWNFPTDVVTDNVTLCAMWISDSVASYVVTFSTGGGSAVDPQTVEAGDTVVAPANPVKAGYTFEGWYSDEAFANRWYFSAGTVTAAMTLYAKWTKNSPNTCTVTFNSKGGSSVSAQEVAYKGTVSYPSIPSKTGYTFEGWYSDSAYTVTWEFGVSRVACDTTLYAKWVGNTCILVLDAQGGAVSANMYSVTYGAAVGALPTPTRAGYIFGGWYTQPEGGGGAQYSASTVHSSAATFTTLYARWIDENQAIFYVTFAANGGNSISAQEVKYNSVVARPVDPTRSGYTFAGWWKDAGFTTRWNFPSDVVTDNVTLCAKWISSTFTTCTVTFATGGGSAVDPQTIEVGDRVATPASPTKAGYTFEGWYTNEAFVNRWDFSAGTATAAMTLYAKWTKNSPNTCTVTFNSKGGSSVSAQEVTYKGTASYPSIPTKTGYTFEGWYGDSAYTGAWEFGVNRVTRDTTLYAKWTGNICVLVLDAHGGAVSPAMHTVTYGAVVGALPTPTRSGYAFSGWYTQPGGGTPYIASTVHSSAATFTTLYARWIDENQAIFHVTFAVNGGSSVSAQEVKYNSVVARPADPTRSGYAFTGWWKDANFTTPWNFSTDVVTGNVTLYAKWIAGSVATYVVTFSTDGGSAVDPQTVEADGRVAMPANPVKAGCTFEGWYSDEAFTNRWDFSANKVAAAMTLYAKWNDDGNSVTVTFNTNGGSLVAPQTAKAGGELPPVANPARENYTFNGWYRDSLLSAQWSFESSLVDKHDMTLYAGWKVVSLRLDGLTINDQRQMINADDSTISYTMKCGNAATALHIALKLPAGITSDFPSNTLTWDVSEPAFKKEIPISLSSFDKQKKEYTLTLQKDFEFSSIVHVQLGGRMLMVINNSDHNGGYCFKDALWAYEDMNGNPHLAQGTNNKFYYISPTSSAITESMYVRLQDSTGTWLQSCLYAPPTAPIVPRAARTSVYPNPVAAGGVVHLSVAAEQYDTYRLLDVLGNRQRSGSAAELQKGLTMPGISGVYFLTLEGKSGKTTVQIAVGKE
jgi:uncharacterized repeat protein (TIGR02543 family)